MPVTSATIRDEFKSYFTGAMGNSVRRPLAVAADYVQDLEPNRDKAYTKLLRLTRSNTAKIDMVVHQGVLGDVRVVMDFGASTPEEFHAILKQVTDGLDAVTARAATSNWKDHAVPTLTSFASSVASVAVSTEKEITLANMKAQGNEADDGTVDGFVVQAVSTGTLKIGPSADLATAFAAGTNDVIDANNNAYWTSAGGASGATNAFTVKAMDNKGWLSATAVQAQVTVS